MKLARTWTGEQDRPLTLTRGCDCGTCYSTKPAGTVGYLTASDSYGNGFTIHIDDDEAYMRLLAVVAPTQDHRD